MVIGSVFRQRKPVAAGVGGAYAAGEANMFAGLSGWQQLLVLVPVGMFGAFLASLFSGNRLSAVPTLGSPPATATTAAALAAAWAAASVAAAVSAAAVAAPVASGASGGW